MAIVKRLLRYFLYTFLAVLALAIGAIAVFTLTERGRENLASLISSMASSDATKIRIGGLNGIWAGPLTLDHLVVEDTEGAWLVARGVEVDWSLLPLLSSTFKAERIFVRRLEVARQPISSGTSGGGGGLPISLAIDRIELPDIALGEALAGTVAKLSAQGSLDALANPLNIQTSLKIARIDGVGGKLDASIHFVPSEKRLDVAVNGSEPAGGIVANLLQLPGAPPVGIVISGSGPAENWRGQGVFSVDGSVVTTVSGAYSAVEGGSRIELKGDGAFERFLPEGLRPLLAGKADFDIAGLLGSQGRIDVERANLQSNALRASAKGTIDPQGASDFALEAEAIDGAVPVSFGAGQAALRNATIRVFGAGNTPMVDATATLDYVTTQAEEARDISVTVHSDGFDLLNRTGPLKVDLSAGAYASANPTLGQLLAGRIEADLAADIGNDAIGVAEANVRTNALRLKLGGEISRRDPSLSLAVATDIVSSALPIEARTALGDNVAFSGTIKRNAEGAVSVEAMQFNSGDLTLGGSLAQDGDTITAALKGTFADLGRLAPDASGAIAFTLDAAGKLFAPDVTLTATSEAVRLSGQELTGVELTAKGIADPANPAGDVSLKGSYRGQALNAAASLKTTDGRREVTGLSVALGQSRVTGDLLLGADFLPEGTLDLSVPDIGALAALAQQEAQGQLSGKITFARADGVPQIAIDATAPTLSRTGVSASNVAVAATIADYLGARSVAGTVRAASLVAGAVAAENVDATIGQQGERVDLKLRANEPEGGTLSRLLGLSGSRLVEVAVSGEGPPAAWNGNGTISMDGALVSTLVATHAAVGGGSRLTVQGDGAFDRFLPDGLKPLLAGETNFDIAALLGTSGGFEIEKADVLSPAFNLVAQGNLDAQGASDFTVRGQAVAGPVALSLGDPAAPLSLMLNNVSARLAGPRNASAIDLNASLAQIAIQGSTLQGVEAKLSSQAFDVAAQSGPLALEVSANALATENQTLAPLLAGQIRAAAATIVSDTAITIQSGSVSSDALTARLSGEITRPDFGLSLALEADAAASAMPAGARGALGERVTLSGTVKRDGAGAIFVEALKLVSGGLSADGSASLSGDTIEAAIKGAFADVGRLAQGATGAITFSLGATGNRNTPDLSLSVESERIEAAGRAITGLSLTASGVADVANPAAKVSLRGNVAGEALTGSAELKTTDGRREINGLSILLGQNRITGDLVLDDQFVPEGAVDFTVPDIGPLAALAFEEASGDVNGTIRFHRANGVPEIVLDAATASLSRAELTAKDVAVAATVSNYLASPAISGKIRAASVTSGATAINGVDVTLTRDGDWTGFSGGATVNAMPARAAGRIKIASGETTIELASGEATVNGMKVGIARATTVVIRDGQAVLDKLPLAISGGNVVVSGTAGETLALDIQLASLPAAAANAFSPGLNATGTISGTARVSGAASKPQIGYQARWTNAGTAQTAAAGLGSMTINSNGTFSGNRLEFQADVGDASGLAIRGGGTVGTAGTPTLDLDFTGRVPFAFLTRQLAAQGMSLTGAADVNIQVRGPATAPLISGTVRTSGARLVDAASGIAINDIAADVSVGSGVATLRSLTGKLSTGGSLSGSGTVGIDPARGFPADLAVRIVEGRYTDGRIVTTTMNGDLTLKGPLVGTSTLGGTLNLGRTVITIPERLPGSLASLNVQHRNAPKAVIAQQKAIQPREASGGGGGGGLSLDLQVNAPQQIFVQGRGLDAELGGSLRLTGPATAPQAIGEFTMRRGRLQILGRRLTFSRGTLDFAGSLIPNIDLAADSTVDTTTVTVQVTGPATDPKFVFSSSPALPEDEVLARLIFGRSMSNLSPLQIAQLAEAAAQLAGVSGPTSLLNNLRNSIGVDDLDITTDAEGNTAVSAGKYLNDRTYLSIEKGDRAGSGRATIDLDVGRGVKLRGSAAEDGEARGGIFFEREY
ncbi:translocation/assembly module TamB domain-containing protein [Mesorhizobium sp. 1B3]|uniref:translocation/assembly module TamB domain-containing protein n=1 Tax=Mesorhizobium sp. 1B3 TaxID=3243599 RepID=UPI003D998C69